MVRLINMGKPCSQNGKKFNILKMSPAKPTGNRHFGRPKCGWEDNIRIDLKESIQGIGLIRLIIRIIILIIRASVDAGFITMKLVILKILEHFY